MAIMKIGVVGCAGRMGRMLMETIMDSGDATLAGGTDHAGNEAIGRDVGSLLGRDVTGIVVGDDAKALFAASDTVIDFTVPMATVMHAHLAAETGAALVAGTTGMDADQRAQLESAAQQAVIVHAGNMSVGINLLEGMVEQISGILSNDYDIEILEMHHHHKVDAPSGTALMLGEAAAAGRGVDLENVSQRARDGQTGARKPGDIGFAALRGGDVVGDHTVIFASEGERIEISHKASSRAIYANGALRAALWTSGRANGLYSMKDVLNIS
jgi:4-hydroxy-tetrahydrodipicolinate reductase